MKLVKTAGKTQVKMSKKEWESIGKKAGWMKIATASSTKMTKIANMQALVSAVQNGTASPQHVAQLTQLVQNVSKQIGAGNIDPTSVELVGQIASIQHDMSDPSMIELVETAKEVYGGLNS